MDLGISGQAPRSGTHGIRQGTGSLESFGTNQSQPSKYLESLGCLSWL